MTVTLRAGRVNSNASGSLSPDFFTGQKFWAGTLDFRSILFTGDVQYEVEKTLEEWITPDAKEIRQDRDLRRFRFRANNRKTRIFVDHYELIDAVHDRDLSRSTGRVNNTHQWGKGSSIRSLLTLTQSSSGTSLTTRTWEQQLRLKHTDQVESGYSYRLSKSSRGERRHNGTALNATVSWRPYRALRGQIDARSQATDFGDGTLETLLLTPTISTNFQLPLDSRLSGTGSLGFERSERTPSRDGWIWIVGMVHIMREDFRFFLNEAGVDPESVQVSRADETLIYERGIDFEILETGVLTEIMGLPGGRILVGDTLLVDYRYHSMPEASREGALARLNLTVTKGPLRFSHRRSLRSPLQETGAGLGAPRFDINQTSMTLQGRVLSQQVSLSFQRNSLSTEFSKVRSQGVNGAVVFNIQRVFHGRLNFRAQREYVSGSERDRILSGLKLNWNPLPSVKVEGGVRGWSLDDPRKGRQELMEWSLQTTWESVLGRLIVRVGRDSWMHQVDRVRNQVSMRFSKDFY
jgi:hypothetical protein